MDVTLLTQPLVAVPLGIGIAAASGFRVFLPLLALGLAARFELVPLAAGFGWLAEGGALTVLGVAALVEIAAYYLPGLDHVLDVLAGPAALVAGAIAMAAVLADVPPALQWALALIAGSGSAGLVQGATTLVRAQSGLLTGGLGNPVVATGELGGATLLSLLAVFLPLLALAAVLVLGVVAVRLGLRAWRRGRQRPAGG